MQKTIAITCGDPAGIGPEIVAAALKSTLPNGYKFLVIGDDAENIKVGEPSKASAKCAVEYLDKAIELAAEHKAEAIVTAPLSKKAINDAGIDFIGQTEYIAAKTNSHNPVMLFVGDKLKVALVTRHIALKKVTLVLTQERIVSTLSVCAEGLRKYFGIISPTIAVCGLNPHAGEGGTFGREEINIIVPAIELAKSKGLNVMGPFPADTLFRKALKEKYDLILAMYHDQGLAPIKALGDSVNVTLGLPFVRTSPDHGTAFDIAGKGVADHTSMIAAIKLACQMLDAKKTLF